MDEVPSAWLPRVFAKKRCLECGFAEQLALTILIIFRYSGSIKEYPFCSNIMYILGVLSTRFLSFLVKGNRKV